MKQFGFFPFLCVIFIQLSAMELSIDERISDGITKKRIDARITQVAHSVTAKYNKTLTQILARGINIANYPGNRRGNTLVLLNDISELSQYLLLDLWQNRNVKEVLACIKAISFTFYPLNPQQSQKWEEEFDAYPWDSNKLFKIMTQPFTHSRTLMGMTGSKLIVNMIDPTIHMENYLLKIERSGESGKTNGEQLLEEMSSSKGKCRFWPSKSYDFTYRHITEGVDTYKIRLSNKTGGGQFGGVFNVIEPSTFSKRYYCKAYWGYPAKGNFNSEKAFASSISFMRTSDIWDDGPVENSYSPLDFKELFIYKVLELLEVGPKAFFFKVPAIKDGFFILTEDLNTATENFVVIGEICNTSFDIFARPLLRKNQLGQLSDVNSFMALLDFLEVDTVNRILRLADSNDRNFGFITKVKPVSFTTMSEEATINWLKNRHNFRIIDFIAPHIETSYNIEGIFSTFLEGNSITRYLRGSIMDLAISRHIEGRDEELTRKNNAEKIFFGKQVISSLDSRFKRCDGLECLLRKAKESVKLFFEQNKFEEISEEYLKNSFADIDRYIDGIVKNYNELKKGIETFEE